MRKNSREKFVELCEKRMNKAIRQIRLIGNLSNRTNYKYDEQDVRKIINTLEAEIKDLRSRFETNKRNNGINFKL